MKKVFTLILALVIGFGLKAQCPLTQAVDFTATDCHGTEIHLFDILDRGQFVFVDFFGFTCISCREAMPYIVESYYRYGCNNEDIFYVEVTTDPEELCFRWCEEFGVEYPTISKERGGEDVRSNYYIPGDPFFMLIAPDRSIVLSSWYNFEISDFQSIVDAFLPFGIQVYQCYAEVEEDNELLISLFPNPADAFVNLSVEGSSMIRVYNAMGQLMDAFIAENQQVKIETTHYPVGLYFVQVDGHGLGKFLVKH